jgi:hypothetical protein
MERPSFCRPSLPRVIGWILSLLPLKTIVECIEGSINFVIWGDIVIFTVSRQGERKKG